MRLDALQEMLAALYLSPHEREEWHSAPDRVVEIYGLDGPSRALIAAMSRKHLDRYASSLYAKRLSQVTKLIPMASAHHGNEVRLAFRRYAGGCLPLGAKKHVADVLAFARWIWNHGSDVPRSMRTLVRLETIPLELNFRLTEGIHTFKASAVRVQTVEAHRTSGPAWRVVRFDSYIPTLSNTLRFPAAGTGRNVVGIFLKFPGASRHLEWHLPSPFSGAVW